MHSLRDQRRTHDLYRFYDAQDRLLYIGISLNAAQRASQHKAKKSWWTDVRRMEVTPLGTITRSDAEQIERAAIQDEQPLHNIVHNTSRHTIINATLEWACEICGETIDDGDGYIELPRSERRRYTEQLKDWESDNPQPDVEPTLCEQLRNIQTDWNRFVSMPAKAHWWAIHRTCDPNINSGGDWFDVATIRTHFDVLDWTAHLMSKNWINDTDWHRLIKRITKAKSNKIIRTDHA